MFDDILGKDEEPPLAEEDKDLFEKDLEEAIESFLEDPGNGFDKSLIDSLKKNIKQKEEIISNMIDELSEKDEIIKNLQEEIEDLYSEIDTEKSDKND